MTVYFARRPSDGLIKIGCVLDADRLQQRLKEVGGGETLELLATTAGWRSTEHQYHRRFAASGVRHVISGRLTEWFVLTDELDAVIAELRVAAQEVERRRFHTHIVREARQ